MKRTYQKPEIIFENFALNTSIASGCEVIVEGASSGTCGLEFGGDMLFQEGITGCTDKPTLGGDGSYNGMCYYTPIETNNLFNSL